MVGPVDLRRGRAIGQCTRRGGAGNELPVMFGMVVAGMVQHGGGCAVLPGCHGMRIACSCQRPGGCLEWMEPVSSRALGARDVCCMLPGKRGDGARN
eukprot:12382704-Alexandrium_andersonii.AAC.1